MQLNTTASNYNAYVNCGRGCERLMKVGHDHAMRITYENRYKEAAFVLALTALVSINAAEVETLSQQIFYSANV